MFGPEWEQGCPSCSSAARPISTAMSIHLNARGRDRGGGGRAAPLALDRGVQKRMGWRFEWVSSYGTDFNYDYRVSFTKEEMGKGNVHYNFGPNGFPSEEAPASVCSTRTGRARYFTPTPAMRAAPNPCSAATTSSTSCRRVAMRRSPGPCHGYGTTTATARDLVQPCQFALIFTLSAKRNPPAFAGDDGGE